MRHTFLAVLVLATVACDGSDGTSSGRDPDDLRPPRANQPPHLGHGALPLGEGHSVDLGTPYDPEEDPFEVRFGEVSEGITLSLVDGAVVVAAGYGVAVDETGAAHASLELIDTHGNTSVVELTLLIERLDWGAPRGWLEANGPSPRRDAVVFDHESDMVVMFGESLDEPGEALADAWRYTPGDGVWSPLAMVGDVPSPGPGKALASTGSDVWLHGGEAPDGSPLADLHRVALEEGNVLRFEFVTQAASPPPRAHHVLVARSDGTAEESGLFLFGGRGRSAGAETLLGDTWTMRLEDDAAAWTPLELADAPSARDGTTLTRDVQRGRAVLFGGRIALDGTVAGDTWMVDLRDSGTPAWTRVATDDDPVTPGPRRDAMVASDPSTPRALVFGGADDDGAIVPGLFALDLRGEEPRWDRVPTDTEALPTAGGVGLATWAFPVPGFDGEPRLRLWFALGEGAGDGRRLEMLGETRAARGR